MRAQTLMHITMYPRTSTWGGYIKPLMATWVTVARMLTARRSYFQNMWMKHLTMTQSYLDKPVLKDHPLMLSHKLGDFWPPSPSVTNKRRLYLQLHTVSQKSQPPPPYLSDVINERPLDQVKFCFNLSTTFVMGPVKELQFLYNIDR